MQLLGKLLIVLGATALAILSARLCQRQLVQRRRVVHKPSGSVEDGPYRTAPPIEHAYSAPEPAAARALRALSALTFFHVALALGSIALLTFTWLIAMLLSGEQIL